MSASEVGNKSLSVKISGVARGCGALMWQHEEAGVPGYGPKWKSFGVCYIFS